MIYFGNDGFDIEPVSTPSEQVWVQLFLHFCAAVHWSSAFGCYAGLMVGRQFDPEFDRFERFVYH